MFQFQIIPYVLHFQFDAGTSRGVLKKRKTWFIKLWHTQFPERIGWGECSPLEGLSVENPVSFEKDLIEVSEFIFLQLKTVPANWEKFSTHWMENWNGPWLPAAWFGWETAWLDWVNGGKQLICDALFYASEWKVPINGLVWMSTSQMMKDQAIEKQKLGFNTIKLKVGALDWAEELDLIQTLRNQMPASEVTIRLDANGAWTPEEALKKLNQLAYFEIHSIEQPIQIGQTEALKVLCKESPIPIALDEELIGKPFDHQKYSLLESVQPQYIVIKPTLVGGLGQSDQWIKMAEDLGIEWWITSMLESNIGLNAIAQLSAQYRPVLPQGLGTGGLFLNNIKSPLSIEKGCLVYSSLETWDFTSLKTF